MDTAIAERAMSDMDRRAGRGLAAIMPPRPLPLVEHTGAGTFAPQPTGLQITTQAAGLNPLARGLAALAPFGHDARRRERFMAARAEGCCHQCHAPLQNLLNDCPCPHWFTTSAATVERIEPVLRMYALADVLHFILLHLLAGSAGRALPRGQLTVSTHYGAPALTARIGRKLWTFRTAQAQGEAARLVVELFNPRTGKRCAVALPATETDLEAMHDVTHAIGGN
jgi:hypothetical protein